MAPLHLRLPERRTTHLTSVNIDAIPCRFHLPGDLPHIPGMASSSASPFSVDEFLQGVPQAGPRNHQQEHFDAIYQQGLQHGQLPGQWQHQAPPSMYPPVNADAQVLSPSLQVRQLKGQWCPLRWLPPKTRLACQAPSGSAARAVLTFVLHLQCGVSCAVRKHPQHQQAGCVAALAEVQASLYSWHLYVPAA